MLGARGGPGAATAGDRSCRSRGVSMAPDRPRFGSTEMAKGQKRSGREPKKPKQDKPKAKAAASPFAALHEKPLARPPEEKK